MYKFSKIIFAYYLLFLFWGILFKFDIAHTINTAHLFPSRSLNVSPFDASGGRLEILFNVLIFIPFGFFIGRFSERSFFGKWGAIFLVSLFVEILQFIFGIGATDITDIITNTSGGLIGLLLYHAFQKNERRQDVISLFFGGFLLFFTFVLLLH